MSRRLSNMRSVYPILRHPKGRDGARSQGGSASGAWQILALALAGSCVAFLTGCVNLAPDYQRPPAAVPVGRSATGNQVPGIARADFFVDARLRSTVELALTNNRDLRVAALNVRVAQAQYRLQNAARLPGIEASVSGTRTNLGSSYGADLSLSAFELDLFGRVRNESEAALQIYLASEAGRTSTEISLVAETANAWLTLEADLQRLRLSQQTLRAQQDSLALDERRHALGAITGLALSQAESSVDSTRSDVEATVTQIAQDRNALELLLGEAMPAEFMPSSDEDSSTASQLVEVPAGVPSELLQRRPDVLQAEHQLQASVADIGVARAAFFPTITLTAAAGTASTALSGLFKGLNRSWSYGPSMSLPLLDWGANRANLDVAHLNRDIAIAQYDKAVQTAFREVADALAVRERLATRLSIQEALVTNARRQLTLAQGQHDAGSIGMLDVLDAQRTLYAAQEGLIALRLADESNRLELYKVLGGGWKA